MGTPVLRSKQRTSPSSVGYGGLQIVQIPTLSLDNGNPTTGQLYTSATPAARVVLPFACKIQAVAANLSLGVSGTVNGPITLNVVAGAGSYETAPAAATSERILTTIGTTPPFSSNITLGTVFTHTIAGVGTITYTTPVANQNQTQVINGLIANFNSQPALTALYTISLNPSGSSSPTGYLLTAITPGASSHATTATVSNGSATFNSQDTPGTAAVVGVNPVLAPPDNLYSGQAPVFAAPGNALFALDQVVGAVADAPQVFYVNTTVNGPHNNTYDAIFPAGSLVTLRVNAQTATGNLDVSLALVPVDPYPMSPESAGQPWQPGPKNI